MAGTIEKPIRVAVIGTGSLGQHHARIYAELATAGMVQFAGLCDHHQDRAAMLAEKFGTRVFRSLEEAAAESDALNIVTPTVTHFAIAKQLLEAGKDLLIEKPMTDNLAHARELAELAQQRGRIVQVGHIERFNPVVSYLRDLSGTPRFIEAQRLSPHPGRNADVGAVLDLMIHDIDIVLALVNAPVVSIEAVGAAVLSPAEDIANARLKFANGCVAQLTASRVSAERVRRIRVYYGPPAPSYVSLDFREQTGTITRLGDEQTAGGTVTSEFGGRHVVRESLPIHKAEPLKLELEHFVHCVRTRQQPLVDSAAAIRALEVAFEITRQVGDAAAAFARP